MANFSYVVDSSYKPFSLQEMLVPFTAYKEEFEKAETAYTDLTDKADKFKYLSETLPEGSKARQLYEGYANNLKTQAEDLAHNGLTRANKTALTSLKRRFQGEIGRVAKADEAMEAEKKLRQTLNAQDSSRLYAMDNLNVDDFLDGKNPNLYSISGNELYTRGAAAGKAASSRVYKFGEGNLTLGGYYRDLVSKIGYGPQAIAKFREDISSNPELAAAVEGILAERGVNENLTGNNLERARQSVINGIIDGAIYQENHTPQRDLGKLTAKEALDDKRTKEAQAITLWQAGATMDNNGNVYGDPSNINYKAKKLAMEAEEIEFNAKYPKATEDIKDSNGNVIIKKGERMINPAYTKDKAVKAGDSSSDDNDAYTKREQALVNLSSDTLGDKRGFEVTDKDSNTRLHYRYIGSIEAEDPEDSDTDYKARDFIPAKKDHKDGYTRRVLNEDECTKIPEKAQEAINNRLNDAGVAKGTEYQIIEATDSEGHKHYSVAVLTN